jgi:hypothetical protein
LLAANPTWRKSSRRDTGNQYPMGIFLLLWFRISVPFGLLDCSSLTILA